MNITENKKHIEIAPALGIGIILILVAIAGLLFYKGLMMLQQEESQQVVQVDVSVVEKQQEEAAQNPETPEEALVQIEQDLEEVSAEVSDGDLFGLDELDAELIDFTELDEIFNFEL